jgi:hypothetical protein
MVNIQTMVLSYLYFAFLVLFMMMVMYYVRCGWVNTVFNIADHTFVCIRSVTFKLCLQKCGMDYLFYFISELVDVAGLAYQRIDLFEVWLFFQYH